jgi:hypothetical protein
MAEVMHGVSWVPESEREQLFGLLIGERAVTEPNSVLCALLYGFPGIRANETPMRPLIVRLFRVCSASTLSRSGLKFFCWGAENVPSYHLEIFSFIGRHCELKASPGVYRDNLLSLCSTLRG